MNKSIPEGKLNLEAFSIYRNAIYGVAIVWITLFHGIILDEMQFPASLSFLSDILSMGNIGVDIFLLLSGMGLYRSFEHDRRIGRFYYKRVLRVYLPFLIIGVPAIIRIGMIRGYDAVWFAEQITTLSFWTGNTKGLNLWYVSAILVFYLLYPAIHSFIFRKQDGSRKRMLILLAGSVILSVVLYYFFEGFYARCSTAIPRLSVFILGCYCGKLVKDKKKVPVAVLIISIIIFIGAYPMYANYGFTGLARRYYGSLTGIALCIIISQVFVLLRNIKLDRFFAFFGGISLEMYITTIVVRDFFTDSKFYEENNIGIGFLNYLLAMIVAVAIAYAVSLIEKPAVRLLMWPLKGNKQKY